MLLVSVAIPVPLRRNFDYEVAQDDAARIVPGVRLRVPFGPRRLIGIATAMPRAADQGPKGLRTIDAVLDDTPLIDAELFLLCRWAADYYRHPLGEVFAAALPAGLRRGSDLAPPAPRWYRITALGVEALASLPTRSPAMRVVLQQLLAGAQPRVSLIQTGEPLRRALAKGWIEPCAAGTGADAPDRLERGDLPALTAQQRAALDAFPESSEGYSASLLDGVTGSGKTEVYLRLTARALAQGRQVLALAPEIGLTPQLAERYTERFGARVACYHSGLSDRERTRVWLAARHGQVDVIVGTRSAVFLPLRAPGLIIVDEEHDVSFKQAEGFRYSARDLAVLRAQRLGVPVLLGSATPSLESLANVESGRYRHVRLAARVGGGAPPAIEVLDIRNSVLREGLSEPLLNAVDRHLQAGGQALLFLNRRGYAPVLLCHVCGWSAKCANCDARMVVHRSRGRMICHHCGAAAAVPKTCPECGSLHLRPIGFGTERIEDALRLRFPGERIERIDSDRLARAGELERLLADVKNGAIRILVGTQVLAKGHDFAGLTFAGIVDADQALYGTDFRAIERMAQVLTQVAGRVGRAGRLSEVLLQTHQPDHPLLRCLVEQGYPALCERLLQERRDTGLPPYASLALIRAESKVENAAMEFLRQAAARLPAAGGVDALGPAAATMERRAGYHRAQLLLRGALRHALHRVLDDWLPQVEDLRPPRGLRWSIDIDPMDLF